MARRRRAPPAKILVLTLGPVIVLAALLTVFLYDSPTLDARSACPLDPGYTQVSLSVVLDATDVYGPAQRLSIANSVWDSVNALEVYDRVKIYTIEPGEQIPLLNLCKPGSNMQDSPAEQQMRELQFKLFTNDALDELQGTRPNSPIIESLGWIAADHERDGSDQRILLVSDLIEHSGVISHYDPNWPEVYETNRTRIHNQCPNLDNIRLDILFPTRPDRATQNNDLVMWWLDYLEACGGDVNSVTRITGTN